MSAITAPMITLEQARELVQLLEMEQQSCKRTCAGACCARLLRVIRRSW